MRRVCKVRQHLIGIISRRHLCSSNKRMDPGFTNADTNPEERAKAAALRTGQTADSVGNGATKTETGDDTVWHRLEQAQIDHDARQKYVLIQTELNGVRKNLVRGRKTAAYHMDAADPTIEILQNSNLPGLKFEVLGGGRIEHSTEGKKIEVYGQSYGFPWEGEPQHDVSAAILKLAYPDYTITTSNEGY